MKEMLGQPWFWFLALLAFLGVILWDDDISKEVQSKYSKQRMRLTDVHFSEIDQGFEHARMYADVVDMDDSQSNMNATQVRTLFFDKQIATKTGELVASWAYKNPFEARFWGDVRLRSSEGDRMRSEELRYFFSRKELYTSMPVTIWKDDMIITGRDFHFNTQTKAGSLNREVLIRIWEPASGSRAASTSAAAPPPEDAGQFIEIAPAAPEDWMEATGSLDPDASGEPAATPSILPAATAATLPRVPTEIPSPTGSNP